MIVDMIAILDMIAICSRFCSPEEVNRIFFVCVQCEHCNSQTYIKTRQSKVSLIHLESVELVFFCVRRDKT